MKKNLTLFLILLLASCHPSDMPQLLKEMMNKQKNLNEENLYGEKMPYFQGGQDSLTLFLKDNINYPQFEKEQGIEGTVYISFIVEKDGTVSTVKIEKEVSNGPGFAREALRVVKLMPKWSPATLKGKPVRLSMTIPIKFVLH